MSDLSPDLREWPGPAPVADVIPGVRVYDPARLASWKGIRFLVDGDPEIRGGRRASGIVAPYVPGQAIHDRGRAAWSVTLDTLWAGDDWRDRLLDFIWLLDTQGGTSGTLCLPEGHHSITAHVIDWSWTQSVSEDVGRLRVTWDEDSTQDWTFHDAFVASTPAAMTVDLPAGDGPALAAVNSFDSVRTDPTASDDDLYTALSDAMATIATSRAALDTETIASVERDEGYVLTTGRMIQSVDDPDALLARGG